MSFFRNPFARKPEPEMPPINEDWQAGDLAQRVIHGPWKNSGGVWDDGPEYGHIARVRNVFEGKLLDGGRAWFLRLEGYGEGGWQASAFRKIRPNHDAADTEFTARIKRCKPVRESA